MPKTNAENIQRLGHSLLVGHFFQEKGQKNNWVQNIPCFRDMNVETVPVLSKKPKVLAGLGVEKIASTMLLLDSYAGAHAVLN